MKKIKLFAIIILCGAGAMKASPVDVNTAKKVAGNFYATCHSAAVASLSLAYTERDASGVPVYYVFNTTVNGFVIVTADDAAHPIIGYSDEGAFVVPASSNNNVSFWLQYRKNEIIAMRAHNVAATSAIKDEWTSYISGSNRTTHNIASSSVLPLCKSYWDQSPYYNAYCPGGSVTGCVATAMAQIMRYWSYPSVGTGSNCYDDATNHGYSENYGELCADFDTSHYVWSAMQLNPLGSNNNQIAKLMYDCGVSVDMDYTPTGSGAEVIGWGASAFNSYTQYFGYDVTTINSAMYSDYTDDSWIALLENELNYHRPMQFEGTDPNEGGHSWVCDGYSATNMMHMNWGWGGDDDGYYSVDSLNPSPFDFDQYIGVIYGIQPPGVASVKQITDNTGISVYPNPSHGVFTFAMPVNNNNYQVTIYNVLGQEVTASTINSGSTQINLSSQPKGIYIYKVISETGEPVSTGRLVVE